MYTALVNVDVTMPQNENQDHDKDARLEHKLMITLRAASDAAVSAFNEMDESPPYGDAGITELDGRKRLARRFKQIANETGYRKFEFRDFKHPLDEDGYEPNDNVRWVLKYDSYERSYSLQHKIVDTSQSMTRKAYAYSQGLDRLNQAGVAEEGRVYSRVD